MTEIELTEIFEYLDELHAYGTINMSDARSYVVDAFGIDQKAAGWALSAWMETWSDEPAADRAARAAKEGSR